MVELKFSMCKPIKVKEKAKTDMKMENDIKKKLLKGRKLKTKTKTKKPKNNGRMHKKRRKS